jgi:hypothetical protein
VNIKKVMRRKNPYLYRAKSVSSVSQIVDSVLSAFISSSEETIFGNVFFEPIALAASGGQKALAEGVDIMIERGNTVYAIAVKSGTSVFNADSRKRQETNFKAANKLAQQGKLSFVPIVGYGYGRRNPNGRGEPRWYAEFAGQAFWEELTGDPDFYTELIALMGTKPEEYAERFNEAYTAASNRLVREFSCEFCTEDGRVDWMKLVQFNSGV